MIGDNTQNPVDGMPEAYGAVRDSLAKVIDTYSAKMEGEYTSAGKRTKRMHAIATALKERLQPRSNTTAAFSLAEVAEDVHAQGLREMTHTKIRADLSIIINGIKITGHAGRPDYKFSLRYQGSRQQEGLLNIRRI